MSIAPVKDSIYISVHSNAGGGTGTETYMYLDGSPAGSQALRDRVHAEVVDDLRAEWDPAWADRGVKTANFGELRLLSTMPGILIETAFHDNPADAAAEKEPRWRRLVARAIYHGVARYFGGDGAALLPEPPRELAARVSGASAALSWSAPPSGAPAGGGGAASGYRIYRSPNGFAFDGGTATAGTTFTAGGLRRGGVTYFRVTATNAGGESFPTATLAVRVPLSDAAPRVLVVDGFDRLDATLNLRVDESPALGVVHRQLLDRRMNTFDYAVEHAAALAFYARDLALESCDNEAVSAGRIHLADADLVDWFVGREDVAHDTFTPAERAAIQAYLEAGGRLLASGADIGTDLEVSSSSAARAFFNSWLRATRVADDAESYAVRSAGGGAFGGQEAFRLDDGTLGLYDADRPDVYAPLGGAATALLYGADGSQGAAGAGIQYAGAYRLVHLGFPLEAVALRGARDLLAAGALDFLLAAGNNPPRAAVAVEPASGTVALTGGEASAVLDGSGSDDGDGGSQGLSYRWEKVAGPGGDRIEAPEGWERGPAGIGYGDGDDATVLADMRGTYASVYLVREFMVPSLAGLENLTLRVAYDDGFAAYLNGVEAARRNLAAGATYLDLAASAIEPAEEVIELAPLIDSLRVGRNVLAFQIHNASLDSSDLSLTAELTGELSNRRERWVAAGSPWFFHRGRTPPAADWSAPSFEPAPRRTPVRFTLPGAYRYRLVVDDGQAESSESSAEVTIQVLPEVPEGGFRRGDADASGAVDITDSIFTLNWLFLGGEEPPAPGPYACGPDGTPSTGSSSAARSRRRRVRTRAVRMERRTPSHFAPATSADRNSLALLFDFEESCL